MKIRTNRVTLAAVHTHTHTHTHKLSLIDNEKGLEINLNNNAKKREDIEN